MGSDDEFVLMNVISIKLNVSIQVAAHDINQLLFVFSDHEDYFVR